MANIREPGYPHRAGRPSRLPGSARKSQESSHVISVPPHGAGDDVRRVPRSLFGSQDQGKAAPEKAGLEGRREGPAFTLKDQDGKDRSLDELLKKGKVALVFYRSADW